jgi:mannose-6-phosphate isomerase-like protein (cupin superfamily)
MKKINFKNKFAKFDILWEPKVIAKLNDYEFKLVKIKNDFIWHHHEETDEAFIVIEGSMSIEFETETITLHQGEMVVVPKGIKHRPFAKEEAKIMIVEPKNVRNTGDALDELTAPNDEWI